MPSLTRTKSIIIAVVAIAIAGGSYAIVSATSGSPTASSGSPTASSGPSSASTGFAGRFGSGGGSNARSGPEPGGTSGTVSSTSASGFTVTTAGAVKVTIKETSSTSYENGTSPASATAVTTGQPVLVLGTTDNTTITATQVIVQPPASNSSTASEVIFFQKGNSGSTKAVGQIPADYVQGQGTIASATEADQATQAALASYPGGIIDRVVKLGNGDYEVHNIGVNWPHHVFVNQNFKVIGAND
jgi:membrane-bound inhibitor of C-type lysozyme